MTDVAAWLEATAIAQHLKASRWTYPLVNAGHILGLALLVGAVVPMDLRLAGLRRRGDLGTAIAILRPMAAVGLVLAVLTGALLFATQAEDYLENRWFLVKMGLLALALTNVVLHPRLLRLSRASRSRTAIASLLLWPAILVCGRMIGFA